MNLRRRIATGTLWAVLESGGQDAIGLPIFVLLARLPGPEAYGLVAVKAQAAHIQAAHIYVNLFGALIANRQLGRAACYELLGFAAGAKAYFREPGSTAAYLAAWYHGHRALIRDWRYLSELRKRELPGPELENA
jgi:hypothetical protein